LGPGTLTFANAGVNTLTDGDLDIGEGTIVLDAGTFNKSRTNLWIQYNGGDIAVGDVGGKTGDLTIQNGAKLYSAGDLNVGRWGGTGHLTVTGAGSSFTNTEASAFIGRDGGTGYVTVNGPGASFNCRYLAIGDNSTGTLTVTNGSANINDEMNVGRYTGNGHLVINGDTSAIVNSNVRTFIGRDGAPGDAIVTGAGSVFNNQYLAVGDNSVATLKVENGAVLNVLNDNVDVGRNNNVVLGNGTVTTDGTVTIARGHLFLGGVGATGVWNQNGGTTTMPNAVFLGEWDSDTAPGVGILNLNGGTFALNAIKYSDWRDANAGGAQTEPATVLSTQTVNFDGGTLKALQNDGGFIYTKGSPNFHVYFKANGGTIDTNGFDVTAGLAFESGAPSDGGMNKIGAGTLTVTGAIQYEGDTTVTAGTLTAAGGINTPLATVYVNTGTTLNATSIVADTLVIGGTHVPVASAAAVPEPSTFALLVLAGLGALLAWRRK
jgi:T5SS/PEP-CTERM-associated repeat protein/autotransporter-associated beta strand protein